MTRINKALREKINRKNTAILKNKDFSLFASNCNGGFILHDINMKFNSPFVNLWMKPKDYIKFLQDTKFYLAQDMEFVKEEGINYPIGMLNDIKIYFQHFSTEAEAKEKWIQRSRRINYNNLFVMFTDRDGCTEKDLRDFDALPYKNKVVFTHIQHQEIKSAFYIKGFEKDPEVGLCFEYESKFTGKKYYDQFDYVSWFNGTK